LLLRVDHGARPPLLLFPDPAPTQTYPLSLHDALPISSPVCECWPPGSLMPHSAWPDDSGPSAIAMSASETMPTSRFLPLSTGSRDRKSTRLNSSHVSISYAVFCLKKKKKDSRSVVK